MTNLGELTCTRCSITKEASEFAISNITKTGRKTRCKSCERELELIRRSSKVEEIREKERARSKSTERMAYQRKQSKKWKEENPEKRSAQIAVGNALRSGKISKTACMVCGDSRVEGHHPDYSEPLLVVWLCHEHHVQLHKEFNSW